MSRRYEGPPTPAWSLRANRMRFEATAAAEYDRKAQKVRQRREAKRVAALLADLRRAV